MRDIKRAIVGVLALAVFVVAPTAIASGEVLMEEGVPASGPLWEADEYPVEATGERYSWEEAEVTGPMDLLTWYWPLVKATVKVACDDAELNGGEHEGPTSTLSLDATYTECKAGAVEATVTMNSCRYEVNGDSAVTSGKKYQSTAAIACEGEDEIEISIVEGACAVAIPAQVIGSEGSNELINVPSGTSLEGVFASMRGSGVEYESEGAFCELLGLSDGLHEDGGADMIYLVQGMYVTDGTEETFDRLEASEYPFSLTGERYSWEEAGVAGPMDLLTWYWPAAKATVKASCGESELDGGEHSGSLTELSLDATHTECKLGAVALTVTMNSCRYEVGDFTKSAGNQYDSTVAIACEGGDKIEMSVLEGFCKIDVPAQTIGSEGSNELLNFNFGYGPEGVFASMRGSGVEYESEGGACGFFGLSNGTHEDGGTNMNYLLQG